MQPLGYQGKMYLKYVIIMIIMQYNFDIKSEKKNIELGPFMHKRPILDLGP